MPLDHRMTYEELLDLDIRRGKASMEWYRATRARYRRKMSWEAMMEADYRLKGWTGSSRGRWIRSWGGRSDE